MSQARYSFISPASDAHSTTGGGSAAQVTVKTLAELTAAAAADGPSVILVQGSISGAAKVQVTSNKSIIGKTGSCRSTVFFHRCSTNGFV